MTFNSIIIRTAYVLIFFIKARAEKEVSFDNGPESSLAEDAYFGLLAASKGFTFGFIEGEMWEKSPFTILDFLPTLTGNNLVLFNSVNPIIVP